MKAFEKIIEEVAAWSATNLTEQDMEFEATLKKLTEEYGELNEAASAYLGPWGNPGDDPNKLIAAGLTLRYALLAELADVVIVAIRLAQMMDADLEEEVSKKWEEVKARNYRKVEPETASNDDRTMIERSSDDREPKYIITRNSSSQGGTIYLHAPMDAMPHWTREIAQATQFTEQEATSWLETGMVILLDGSLIGAKDAGAKMQVLPTAPKLGTDEPGDDKTESLKRAVLQEALALVQRGRHVCPMEFHPLLDAAADLAKGADYVIRWECNEGTLFVRKSIKLGSVVWTQKRAEAMRFTHQEAREFFKHGLPGNARMEADL